MSAFVPSTTPGSFTVNKSHNSLVSSRTQPCNETFTATKSNAPRMIATIPDPNGPSTTKYLQFISADRLNKAPAIVINQFKNPEFNSISMSLPQITTDIGAGDNLKAGVDTFITANPKPIESKYSSYYDPSTLHEAPAISITYCGEDSYTRPAVTVCQSATPLRVEAAKDALKNIAGSINGPDPALYPAFTVDGRLNVAPEITISKDEKYVQFESTIMGLNLYAAEDILSQYRS